MSWKELSHADGHVLVEYADGSRLNIRYDDLIARHDPEWRSEQPANMPSFTLVATRYVFKAGDVLPEHEHGKADLHDILVESGEVMIRSSLGDMPAKAGERIALCVGEKHAIEAITDAITLHTLVT